MEKCNFQIQYFSAEERRKFKEWAQENKMSMNELLVVIILLKETVQKALDHHAVKQRKALTPVRKRKPAAPSATPVV